jgi:hypothetical protein
MRLHGWKPSRLSPSARSRRSRNSHEVLRSCVAIHRAHGWRHDSPKWSHKYTILPMFLIDRRSLSTWTAGERCHILGPERAFIDTPAFKKGWLLSECRRVRHRNPDPCSGARSMPPPSRTRRALPRLARSLNRCQEQRLDLPHRRARVVLGAHDWGAPVRVPRPRHPRRPARHQEPHYRQARRLPGAEVAR